MTWYSYSVKDPLALSIVPFKRKVEKRCVIAKFAGRHWNSKFRRPVIV
jgi:hypothetical protein